MKLFLAGHGETKENVERISQGHSGGTLTAEGKNQAKLLAKRLSKEKIDTIYSSDLKRCKDTLKPLIKNKKIPVFYTKELRERNSGIFQGKSHQELKEWNQKQLEKYPRKDKYLNRPPKGESYLIMSHGGPLVAIKLYLFRKEPKTHYKKYRLSNAALSIINLKKDGKHRAKIINSIKHLNT